MKRYRGILHNASSPTAPYSHLPSLPYRFQCPPCHSSSVSWSFPDDSSSMKNMDHHFDGSSFDPLFLVSPPSPSSSSALMLRRRFLLFSRKEVKHHLRYASTCNNLQEGGQNEKASKAKKINTFVQEVVQPSCYFTVGFFGPEASQLSSKVPSTRHVHLSLYFPFTHSHRSVNLADKQSFSGVVQWVKRQLSSVPKEQRQKEKSGSGKGAEKPVVVTMFSATNHLDHTLQMKQQKEALQSFKSSFSTYLDIVPYSAAEMVQSTLLREGNENVDADAAFNVQDSKELAAFLQSVLLLSPEDGSHSKKTQLKNTVMLARKKELVTLLKQKTGQYSPLVVGSKAEANQRDEIVESLFVPLQRKPSILRSSSECATLAHIGLVFAQLSASSTSLPSEKSVTTESPGKKEVPKLPTEATPMANPLASLFQCSQDYLKKINLRLFSKAATTAAVKERGCAAVQHERYERELQCALQRLLPCRAITVRQEETLKKDPTTAKRTTGAKEGVGHAKVAVLYFHNNVNVVDVQCIHFQPGHPTQVELGLQKKMNRGLPKNSNKQKESTKNDNTASSSLPLHFFDQVDVLVCLNLKRTLEQLWPDEQFRQFIARGGAMWCLFYSQYLLDGFSVGEGLMDEQYSNDNVNSATMAYLQSLYPKTSSLIFNPNSKGGQCENTTSTSSSQQQVYRFIGAVYLQQLAECLQGSRVIALYKRQAIIPTIVEMQHQGLYLHLHGKGADGTLAMSKAEVRRVKRRSFLLQHQLNFLAFYPPLQNTDSQEKQSSAVVTLRAPPLDRFSRSQFSWTNAHHVRWYLFGAKAQGWKSPFYSFVRSVDATLVDLFTYFLSSVSVAKDAENQLLLPTLLPAISSSQFDAVVQKGCTKYREYLKGNRILPSQVLESSQEQFSCLKEFSKVRYLYGGRSEEEANSHKDEDLQCSEEAQEALVLSRTLQQDYAIYMMTAHGCYDNSNLDQKESSNSGGYASSFLRLFHLELYNPFTEYTPSEFRAMVNTPEVERAFRKGNNTNDQHSPQPRREDAAVYEALLKSKDHRISIKKSNQWNALGGLLQSFFEFLETQSPPGNENSEQDEKSNGAASRITIGWRPLRVLLVCSTSAAQLFVQHQLDEMMSHCLSQQWKREVSIEFVDASIVDQLLRQGGNIFGDSSSAKEDAKGGSSSISALKSDNDFARDFLSLMTQDNAAMRSSSVKSQSATGGGEVDKDWMVGPSVLQRSIDTTSAQYLWKEVSLVMQDLVSKSVVSVRCQKKASNSEKEGGNLVKPQNASPGIPFPFHYGSEKYVLKHILLQKIGFSAIYHHATAILALESLPNGSNVDHHYRQARIENWNHVKKEKASLWIPTPLQQNGEHSEQSWNGLYTAAMQQSNPLLALSSSSSPSQGTTSIGSVNSSTGEKSLRFFIDKYHCPVGSLIIQMRKIEKELQTYSGDLFTTAASQSKSPQQDQQKKTNNNSFLSANATPDHCIHHTLVCTNTITGRLSSNNPNCHSIPKGNKSSIRRYFTSRFGSENGLVMEADYSQLEVMVLALLSRDPNMIADLNHKIDFHCKRVALMKPEYSYDHIMKKCKVEKDPKFLALRQAAKTFSFQQQYGAGRATISQHTGLSFEQIDALTNAERDAYPYVFQWYDMVNSVLHSGYSTRDDGDHIGGDGEKRETASPIHPCIPKILENIDARRKPSAYGVFPLISGNTLRIAPAPTGPLVTASARSPKVKNYPVQSFAGEIVLILVGELCQHFFRKNNYEGKALLMNTVHDCVWIDCHRSVAREVAKDVTEILGNAGERVQQLWPEADVKIKFGVEVLAGESMIDLRPLNEVEGI